MTNEADRTVGVAWNAVPGAVSYDVWTSPVSGGGYTKANASPIAATDFTLEDLRNGSPVYVVVTANDAAGNASSFSNEVKRRSRSTSSAGRTSSGRRR